MRKKNFLIFFSFCKNRVVVIISESDCSESETKMVCPIVEIDHECCAKTLEDSLVIWYLHLRASSHMTSQLFIFTKFTIVEAVNFQMDDKSTLLLEEAVSTCRYSLVTKKKNCKLQIVLHVAS